MYVIEPFSVGRAAQRFLPLCTQKLVCDIYPFQQGASRGKLLKEGQCPHLAKNITYNDEVRGLKPSSIILLAFWPNGATLQSCKRMNQEDEPMNLLART